MNYTLGVWATAFSCRLSGISPFLGDSDAETCQNVSVGDYDYEDEFPAVSQEAKDFIDGLLIRNPKYVGGVGVWGGGR